MAVVPLVAPWRAIWFVESLRSLETATDRRGLTFRSTLLTLADIPCCLGLLLVVISGWRARPLIRSLKASASHPVGSWSALFTWHWAVFVSMWRTLFELPCVPLMLLSLWRFPRLWCAMCEWDDKHPDTLRAESPLFEPKGMSRCKLAVQHAFLALCDVFALFAAIVVICTGWQTRAMVRSLKTGTYLPTNPAEASMLAVHTEICRHFFLFVRDIPLIVMLAFSCITFWRIPSVIAFVRSMEEASSARQNMVSASKLAICAILGPICAVLISVVLLSWRHFNGRRVVAESMHADAAVGAFHRATFAESLQLLYDIPFIALSPLSLWRFPLLVRSCRTLANASAVRMSVPGEIFRALCDVLSIGALLLALLVPWRTFSILGKTIVAIKETISPDSDFNKPAAVAVTAVTVFLPKDSNNHGLGVKVVGTKPEDFCFDAAQLHLEGNIWTRITEMVGASAVSAAKLALHPVSLCPKFLDATTCKAGSKDFKIEIRLATGPAQPRLSHGTLLKHVRTLLASGDCSFCMRVSYQGGPAGAARGALFRFKLNVSDIEAGRTEFTQAAQNGSKKLDLYEEACNAKSPAEDEPCALHVAALGTTITVVKSLPIELLALVMCVLPPFACTLPVLSILFGLGRWKVSDDDRCSVLLECCKNSLLNLVASLALCACLVAPWNVLSVIRAVHGSMRAADSCVFQHRSFKCFMRTLLNIPLDVLGLVCALLPPFLCIPEVSSLILSVGPWAVSPAKRSKALLNMCGRAFRDLLVLCTCLMVTLTLWRLPSLVWRMWECNTDYKFRARGRREAIQTAVYDTVS